MKHASKLLVCLVVFAMMLTLSSAAYIVIDNCDLYQADTTPKWAGTYPAQGEGEAPEGDGYIVATPAGGCMILAKGWEDGYDITEFSDGYYSMKIYVEDITTVTSGQIEMYSDNQTNSWDLLPFLQQDGWNDVSVKISTGTIGNGGLDYANFGSMRVFAYTSNVDNVLGIDDMTIGKEEFGRDLIVDTCDTVAEESTFVGNSWVAGGMITDQATVEGAEEGKTYYVDTDNELIDYELDTPAFMEGHGALFTEDKNLLAIAANIQNPVDISAYDTDDAYLMFWVYLSDGYGTSLAGQIEFTSSGSADVEEISWSMAELSYITDGWNPVALPLSTASTWMENVDLTHMNSFRIYDFPVTGEDVEMRIDNLCFGTYDEAVELGFIVPAEEETEEVAESVEEAVESVEEAVEEAVESVEEEVEEAVESAVEGAENAAAAAAEEATGLSTGAIVGIAAGAVVVIGAVIAAITAASKKKKK